MGEAEDKKSSLTSSKTRQHKKRNLKRKKVTFYFGTRTHCAMAGKSNYSTVKKTDVGVGIEIEGNIQSLS